MILNLKVIGLEGLLRINLKKNRSYMRGNLNITNRVFADLAQIL